MTKIINNNKLMFLILTTFAVIISIYLKNENFFDLANYHYYNPWAFLNGRVGYDIAPGSLLTFLNPLLDLPRYFTIIYLNNHVNWFYAVNGLWFGLLLFVFYQILKLFFDTKNFQDSLYLIMAITIAATGRMTWFQVGSCTNDIILAFINLSGLFLLLKTLQNKHKQKLSNFIFAGLLLGAGLGLKGTNITVCIAAGMSLIIGYKWLSHPIKFISIFAIAGFSGFFLLNGWWMYKLWMLYDNPFFPLFNNIFHSEYFEPMALSVNDFLPSWKQLAICPYLALDGRICNAEGITRDYRLQIFYTLAIAWLCYLFFAKKIKYYYQNNHMGFFFYLFLLFDYLLWAKLLGVQHYFIVIEMCGAILLTQSIKCWYNTKKYRGILYIITYCLWIVLASTPIIENGFGNIKGRNKVIDVEPLKLPKHTLIKLYNLPLAGLLPEISKYNDDFRAVGISTYIDVLSSTGINMTASGKLKEKIDMFDKEYQNQVVIFRLSANLRQAKIIWDSMANDLKGKECRILQNSFAPIFGQPIYICTPKEQ